MSQTNNMPKKKKFITFPYPYMNGILHLGHAYTLLSADIQARYYKMKGYDVLFPFGFHGSGMPIVSCANKLKYELEQYRDTDVADVPSNTQMKILMDMEVPYEELSNFLTPEHWVRYFSENAKKDLMDFNVHVDFKRSFYTTQMNPYYDSFVNWQFEHLMEDGYVTKGTRYVVYSVKDKQPCADHDRRKGEGVKPIQLNTKLVKTNYGNLLCVVHDSSAHKIYINSKEKFVKLHINNITIICNEHALMNIIHQINDTNVNCSHEFFTHKFETNDLDETYEIEYCDMNINFGTGFYISNDKSNINKTTYNIPENTVPSYTYYEPEEPVISRTGDNCIVALTEQWFINYANPELKENVCHYVENKMKNSNPSLQHLLINSVRELHEWPCSRNFGLGTFIPGTNDLVDSLSDSTIYMAYYTISHLIDKIPKEYITREMFDFIFLGKEYDMPVEHQTIVYEMRKEFMFWYPVDIRISGKDLITNHLSMSLYNHYAIWKHKDYFPRSYITNGYLMVKMDGSDKPQKMSKSEGTFITMRDGIRKYGVNATRYTLAYNYGHDDGVFDEKFAKSISNKFGENDWMKNHFTNLTSQTFTKMNLDDEMDIWDNVFYEDINFISSQIDKCYENIKYKEVIDLFEMLINSKNEYVKMQPNLHKYLIDKYVNCALSLLYPIVPNLVSKIQQDISIEHFSFPDYPEQTTREFSYYRDIINDICNQSRKLTKKITGQKNISISIYKSFTSTENCIIATPSIIDQQTSKAYGQYKAFYKYTEVKTQKYGRYMFDPQKEFDLVRIYAPVLLGDQFNVQTHFIDASEESQFKHGPGNPKIAVIK
jgi:leucyl-tRNA synthetase